MKTVDIILNDMKNLGFDKLYPEVPLRDIKILKSISSLMNKESYITESQGKLLIKIFKENLEHLGNLGSDVIEVVKQPNFSKDFRQVENTKKCSIQKTGNGEFFIVIEISYKKDIRKILSDIQKKINDKDFQIEGSRYLFTFTEKNIVTIYESLTPLKFEFSTDFLDLYKKIKSIDAEEIQQKFKFEKLFEEKIKNYENLLINEKSLIILDRKIRYQYDFDKNFEILPNEKLAYSIACRDEPKIFVNEIKYSFDELLQSLQLLHRNKILVIFDEFRLVDSMNALKMLKKSAEKYSIKNIGIYFRFDNKNEGTAFNKVIADNKLNVRLDEDTQIAGIGNGKIPKFLLKNSWYPDAVISFTNNFKNNRSDVYCNNCDLIVYYTHTKPLISKCYEIL